MTCIAAVITSNSIQFAGDRCMSSGDIQHLAGTSKVWRHGRILFGAAGSCDYCAALQFRMQLNPDPDTDEWDDQFMHTGFCDIAREAVKPTSWRENEDCGKALIGFYHKGEPVMYELDGLTCFKFGSEYAAVGSGRYAAMGILRYIDLEIGLNHTVLSSVMESVARHSQGVTGPFDFLQLSKPATVSHAPATPSRHATRFDPFDLDRGPYPA